ncbi:MAG: hypothetical protein ONB23_10895 [candidate division KSB1 bacterium]|nr:hypothetical protein [candidate division KSB1 bacterium]
MIYAKAPGPVLRRAATAQLPTAVLLAWLYQAGFAQAELWVHWTICPPLPRGRDFELTAQYGEGTRYYLDRDYTFSGFQEPLGGGLLLRTFNDLKYDSLVHIEDRDRWTCLVWVDRPAVVYLLWDWRTLHQVPLWLWNAHWQLTPLRQYTTDTAMGFFAVLRKVIVPGDTLRLGHPMADGVPTGSMYVLVFKAMVDAGRVPRTYGLGPVYPNPAAQSAVIPFDVLDRCWVRIRAWDVRGRPVALLQDGVLEPGHYQCTWRLEGPGGLAIPCGVYLVRMDAGPFWSGITRLVVAR